MAEIETGVLTDILMENRLDQLQSFGEEKLADFKNMSFGEYFMSTITQHNISKAAAIANSGIEVHYAYQILSGLKNGKRDKLICLCIGGGLTIKETNRALARAEAGCLYPKRMRDAIIMLAINKNIHTVWETNDLLATHHQTILE